MIKFIKNNILYVAWNTTVVSMAGSLYFSEFLGFPPCVLCWYQRIAMYPLVLILAVGIIKKDRYLYSYVLPFSLLGGAIAFYHNLLYYKLLPDSLAPCISGISCTTKFIEWFGFVTIPLLSLLSFIFITIAMLIYKKLNHDQRN